MGSCIAGGFVIRSNVWVTVAVRGETEESSIINCCFGLLRGVNKHECSTLSARYYRCTSKHADAPLTEQQWMLLVEILRFVLI